MTQRPLTQDLIIGTKGLCPKCTNSTIFKNRFSLEVKDTCSSCGFGLAENDSGDGPAVFIIFILSFSVIPLALIIEYIWGWPTIVHVVVWSTVILGLSIGLLKPAKGITLALQYRHLPETMKSKKD